MKLHREGTAIIAITLTLAIAVFILSHLFMSKAWAIGLTTVALGLLVFVTQFFRIPRRTPTLRDDAVICPADGKVVVIENTYEGEYLKQDCLMISVFMSPLNVHQNVFPVSGNVLYEKHHKGRFMAAWHAKASELNERHTVVIDRAGTPVLMRQIAGAMARRISCYAKVGDQAKQCGEMGFIKFGSRVDVFLPLDAQPAVEIGDKVRNSVSVLATLPG